MKRSIKQIKEGIKLHVLETGLFKTNIVSMFLTMPLERENVTENAMIPAILKRGSTSMPTQEEISKALENMYGATFNCGIDKNGDNQVLKFYIETINDQFLPAENSIPMMKETIDKLFDIVFHPVLEDGSFRSEYFDTEKENMRRLIQGKIDNKDLYAFESCISAMYGEKGFGLYKFGYIEDLDKITKESLYRRYESVKNTAKIDIFVSGDVKIRNIEDMILAHQCMIELPERKENYILNNEFTEKKQKVDNIAEKFENMNIVQGKLVMGLNICSQMENLKYVSLVYDTILGGSANSMLFQNVREKASLAYTARSSYVRQKNNIFIHCGIEIANYEKAVRIIKEQLQHLKDGDITEEDLQNAKRHLISGIKAIEIEQDVGIVYYMGQELAKSNVDIDEYIKEVEKVTMQDVQNLAQDVEIHTIYFLKNE